MEKYKKEAHDFFSNLSDEEFVSLLEDVGFDVKDGNGEGGVVFTDEQVLHKKFQIKTTFSMKSNSYSSSKNTENHFSSVYNTAC